MASSSRRDGAGGKKRDTSGTPREDRAARKAVPAGARKRRGKSETGVIAVKRAGVLPRQARARSLPAAAADAPVALDITAVLDLAAPPLEVVPAVEVPPVAAALPRTTIEDTTEEMSLTELADMTTHMVPRPEDAAAALEEAAPSLAEVVMPPLDVEPPPAPPVEPQISAPAPTGMGWLMSKLRQWAGWRR